MRTPASKVSTVSKCLGSFIALIAVAMVACGGDNPLLVEQREIRTGNFNGLAIGMNREQALAVAKKLGAYMVSAIPCQRFRISKDNATELPSLSGLDGIRVTNRRDLFADIYFGDGQVSKITRSPTTDLMATTGIGDRVDAVRARLLLDLNSQDGLSVTPIIADENSSTLKLGDLASDQALRFQSHNCWRFEVNSVAPAGATYEIYFGDGGLERISYRRPRIKSE
jgi:hypothetical protein